MQDFGLKIRFEEPKGSSRGIGFYDAATSLQGFAQALQIILRAYYSDEVVDRAMPLKRAALKMGSPRRGSVVVDLDVHFADAPVAAPSGPDVFYDFVRYSLAKATGQTKIEPLTSFVSRRADDQELIFDQLAEVIEGSLQRAHRSINNDVPKVALERPRSALIEFNKETSEWVNTREENPEVKRFTGNITRYNSKTGNARAYIKQLGKIIPIRQADSFSHSKRGLLTWSLHGDTISTNKELEFFGRQIESAREEPKRLILTDVNQI
jgi:hypothetical protein